MSADRPRGACPTRLPTSTWSPFFTTGSHSAPICCCMGSTISLGTGMSMVSSSAVSLRWGTTAPRVRRNRDNRAVAFMGVHSPRRALAGAVGRCADRTEPHLAVCGQGEALNSLRYEMLVILREPHVRFQESSVKGNHDSRVRNSPVDGAAHDGAACVRGPMPSMLRRSPAPLWPLSLKIENISS